MPHRRRNGIFLLEILIKQEGFRAGIIEVNQHGRCRYLVERPGRESRVITAASSWDARRRIRAWIQRHYERGLP
jgi:hypothetical protein